MRIAENWKDYVLLDAGSGERLEDWNGILLRRPDPQAIWQTRNSDVPWNRAHARYHRSESGGGKWEFHRRLPESWTMRYGNLQFRVKPMGFKHLGLFPEQAVNWDFSMGLIAKAEKRQGRRIRVLNLFAYTGGATVAAAAAGAEVVHVDAAKGMVAMAKENALLSGLGGAPVRYIVDDVVKFVEREARRGRAYDGIIMDPPSYGRGPKGEIWKFEDELWPLIEKCMAILTEQPLFFIVNSYTTGVSPTVVANVLELTLCRKFGGSVEADELGLPVGQTGLVLPCGATTRWQGAKKHD